jgi:hypothetical protein
LTLKKNSAPSSAGNPRPRQFDIFKGPHCCPRGFDSRIRPPGTLRTANTSGWKRKEHGRPRNSRGQAAKLPDATLLRPINSQPDPLSPGNIRALWQQSRHLVQASGNVRCSQVACGDGDEGGADRVHESSLFSTMSENPHRNLERVCSLERGLGTANIGQPASADPEGRGPPRRTAVGAGCHGAQGGDNKHSPEHPEMSQHTEGAGGF